MVDDSCEQVANDFRFLFKKCMLQNGHLRNYFSMKDKCLCS